MLDRTAVVRGAGYALFWLVPAAVLNIWAASGDNTFFVLVTFFLILMGFAFGGYAVAQQPLTTPLQHGAAVALLSFAVIQGVLILVAIGRDKSINIVGLVFTGMLAVCAGMLGAIFAQRQARPMKEIR